MASRDPRGFQTRHYSTPLVVEGGIRFWVTADDNTSPTSSPRHRSVAGGTLFCLTQEFAVNFTAEIHLTVGDALHFFRSDCFRSWFHRKQYFSWTGSAIARFEPSTSSELHVVHLRIVQIVAPSHARCKCRHTVSIMKPEAGQLLTFLSPRHAPVVPWVYDIDDSNSSRSAALRVLWDNSGRYDPSFRARTTGNENDKETCDQTRSICLRLEIHSNVHSISTAGSWIRTQIRSRPSTSHLHYLLVPGNLSSSISG
ncbi:hypothetical protein B0H12DRAFT_1070164 [Mycena haematopus]|nr:hypothetical protein B0H12DRAFT_1070164 [Mycena haematopus]